MPLPPDWDSMQWSVNVELYAWFQTLAARLGTNTSFLLRSFFAQLKGQDALVLSQLEAILEAGMREAIVDPKVARVYLDTETQTWLTAYVAQMRHPKYPRRRVWLRHLINGYVLRLRQNESSGTIYAAGRLLQLAATGS